MKINLYITFIAIISLYLPACVAHQLSNDNVRLSANSSSSFVDDSMTRTGLIDTKELVNNYPKFRRYYDEFEADVNDIKSFGLLKDMDIVVFFGLWCHDSQREVGRLIKLIEQSGNLFNSVKFVALNTSKDLSNEYSEQFVVEYTPTIFLIKGGQTLATVVERPKSTLAKDLLGQILH